MSNAASAYVGKDICFAVAPNVIKGEVTYEDLDFSKSTGGRIYFSKRTAANGYSKNPTKFIYVSNEVTAYYDVDSDEVISIENNKGEKIEFV